jgi:hypothetical protein
MKSDRIYQTFIVLFSVFFLALPVAGQAQDSELSPTFTREQLAQMLAPVALYPDTLLAQVLMASTYPIEVVEADRWVKKNSNLKDVILDDALQAKDWDPSVKALCHFPTVLALMSERIGETTNIGNAFLAQEEDVMAMVQELRARAHEQGNLKSSAEQKVIVEKETIIIEPADPRVIYVPYYDPLYIYGPWWYPAYPPYYWGPSRVAIGVGISYWPGFFFSFTFGSWSYFDWPRHYIYIDVHKRPRFVRHDRWIVKSGHWDHVPHHRRGVAYRDKSTARKYGQYPFHFRTFDRDIRGFPGRRDLDRTRIDRDRQMRQQTEQLRQTQQRARSRQRAEQERRMREQTEQERKSRQQAEQARQSRQRAEQRKQPRLPEQAGQSPQRSDRQKQWRERTEQERQMRERSERNIFNRVDEGRRERESSERGRMSRGGRQGDGARGRSPGDGGGGREDRDRGDGGGRGRTGR